MSGKEVVILGNGIAANSAAAAVRSLDDRVPVTLVSYEPHPAYSACVLAHYVGREIRRRQVFLKTLRDYPRQGLKIALGKKATAIDTEARKVLLEDGALPYHRLIIATGGTPVLPPIPGADKAGVYTFKTLADADLLARHRGRRATVVGAGPIGVEVAMALERRGYQVHLVELEDRILPRAFDGPIASRLAQALQEKGMAVLTGERVLRFLGDEKVTGVVTQKRGQEGSEETIPCDLAVLSVGIRPEVRLAREAGVALGRLGGIATDEHLMTSIPGVYACGDCIESRERGSERLQLSMLWPNAREQGWLAGLSILGQGRAYPGSQNISGINAYGTCAVALGRTAADLKGEGRVDIIEKPLGASYYQLVLCDGVLRGAQGLGDVRRMGPLLSALQGPLEVLSLSRLPQEVLTRTAWRQMVLGSLGPTPSTPGAGPEGG